eukprot:m.7441 g.7441  ORF g.7441 m.7441 type:complete len:232 (+) comp5251_c0_seq1:111-806(+)
MADQARETKKGKRPTATSTAVASATTPGAKRSAKAPETMGAELPQGQGRGRGRGRGHGRGKGRGRGRGTDKTPAASPSANVQEASSASTLSRSSSQDKKQPGKGGKGAVAVAVRPKKGTRTKRPAMKFAVAQTDIYVARNSPFEAQLAKAISLLETAPYTTTLYGLGAAINRAINIALRVKELVGEARIKMEISTDTLPLLDEVASADLDAVPSTTTRNTSAIRIVLHATR